MLLFVANLKETLRRLIVKGSIILMHHHKKLIAAATTRVFIALTPDSATVAELLALQAQIYSVTKINPARWYTQDKLHLTLRFFSQASPDIISVLQQFIATCDCPPLVLESRKLGALPPRQPRVLTLNTNIPDELANIYSEINSALASIGVAKERRPFLPHITLARIKSGLEQPYLGRLPATLNFNKLSLYKSQLRPSGSVYTPISSKLLADT